MQLKHDEKSLIVHKPSKWNNNIHISSGVVSYQDSATCSAHWEIKLLSKPREEQKHSFHS